MYEKCFPTDVSHNLWEIKSIYALPNEGRIVGFDLRGGIRMVDSLGLCNLNLADQMVKTNWS